MVCHVVPRYTLIPLVPNQRPPRGKRNARPRVRLEQQQPEVHVLDHHRHMICNTKRHTEIRAGDEPLDLGIEVVVLEQDDVSSLTVLHKVVLTLIPPQVETFHLNQSSKVELVSCIGQSIPLLFSRIADSLLNQ